MTILIISLTGAKQRREFQTQQLSELNLDFQFLDATSVDDIDETVYAQHYQDWQRPLKTTEVACYYSHQHAWNKVIQANQPALILEDDAVLSKCVPELLADLLNRTGVDLINFENRGRKKFVSRTAENIACNSKLLRLYQDRTGAAGYLLWPSGAKKLLQCEQQTGIALADAHITACYSLRAYQVEPAAAIQLDHCDYYHIHNPSSQALAKSTVSSQINRKGGWRFWLKRLIHQLKLGWRQLGLLRVADRRYIAINTKDFYRQ